MSPTGTTGAPHSATLASDPRSDRVRCYILLDQGWAEKWEEQEQLPKQSTMKKCKLTEIGHKLALIDPKASATEQSLVQTKTNLDRVLTVSRAKALGDSPAHEKEVLHGLRGAIPRKLEEVKKNLSGMTLRQLVKTTGLLDVVLLDLGVSSDTVRGKIESDKFWGSLYECLYDFQTKYQKGRIHRSTIHLAGGYAPEPFPPVFKPAPHSAARRGSSRISRTRDSRVQDGRVGKKRRGEARRRRGREGEAKSRLGSRSRRGPGE